ncbi:MAG TPA: PRC-barrel domain-containing protein [Ktedonobacteraceae bacterium]|nr:PRC-barrel domain-containing protein [Ktedonobacteraceae bacterium]
MQNTTATRRWSELKGLAVVTINTGQKAGTIDDFYFNSQGNSVPALRIKTSLIGHRVLLSGNINAIGVDAVTFVDPEHLIKENDDELLKTLPVGSTVLSYRVLSQGGTVIGTIGNIVLDISVPAALKVVAFELSAGIRARISGHYPTFDAAQVVQYGRDVIVVPDAIGEALQKD